MKTGIKLLVLFTVIVTTTVINLHAQPYYQTTTTYDLGNGITYKCDIEFDILVILYNSKNIYTYEEQTWADGGVLSFDVIDNYPSFTMTSESDLDIQNRVNSALTPVQKQIMGKRTLAISVIINTKTGKVMELFFRFPKDSPCTELPPSVFRQIELNFTNNPTIPGFKLVEIGPFLNYVMFTWAHQFK